MTGKDLLYLASFPAAVGVLLGIVAGDFMFGLAIFGISMSILVIINW